MHWRIGIDVGGTFTDFIAVPVSGQALDLSGMISWKVASTPDDPSEAVETGLRHLFTHGVRPAAVASIAHGTTIALNAILQGTGAEVALVVSQGHRDVLEIGRARLPRSFDLHALPPHPAVPRDRVVEIPVRLSPEGETVVHREGYDEMLDRLRGMDVSAIAVGLVGAYAGPAVEQELADRIGADLGIPTTASSRVWPESGEFERLTLAVLDAQITPLMRSYFASLDRRLHELGVLAPLYVTASNGGCLPLDEAIRHPIATVLSGPAAGVTAASRLWPGSNLLTIDMGGTSSDIGVLRAGRPVLSTSSSVGDYPIVMPVVEVSAIGAGGGSVVWADRRGTGAGLRVGPRSLGADPGPSCYGRGGTDAGLTDAFVAAGIINPERFLDGTFPLDSAAARGSVAAVYEELAERDAGSVDRFPALVLRVATAAMSSSIRTVLARHGETPEGYAFVAFGGAGGIQTPLLADELEADHVIIPAHAGTFCALGAAIMPVRRDFVRSVRAVVDGSGEGALRRSGQALADEAVSWFESQTGSRHGQVELATDLRFAGQPTALTVPMAQGTMDDVVARQWRVDGAELRARFIEQHREHYGFADEDDEVHADVIRVVVRGDAPKLTRTAGGAVVEKVGTRPVLLEDGWCDASVIRTRPGDNGERGIPGPAVIDAPDTTVLVPPGWTCSADSIGNVHLTRTGTDGEGRR